MPKTKNQGKYVGPFTASKITDSHVVISHKELASNKDKKVPIHIARVYHERENTPMSSRKRKAVDITDYGIKNRKISQSVSVRSNISKNRKIQDDDGDVSRTKVSQSNQVISMVVTLSETVL